jgi:hypothetical protein
MLNARVTVQFVLVALALVVFSSRSSAETVSCSSDDGHRHYCNADTRGGVRMVKQNSESACQQGSTWGYDRQGIWVDRGCRAEFATDEGRGEYREGDRYDHDRDRDRDRDHERGGQVISCSSDDMHRHYCAADTRGGVRMVKQNSDSACQEGSSWGYDRRGIWVDRGCRADFEVGR